MELQMRRLIAVNDNYICYALRQGHVRMLSTQFNIKDLLKAHAAPVTDIQ